VASREGDARGAPRPLSVDEALDYILSRIQPLDSQPVAITQALDRVLAADVVSGVDVPPFVNSAMDGYAVRAADVAGATPRTPAVLKVTGEVPAGQQAKGPLTPGGAMRIMTGAPLPLESDAVVPFEQTDQGRTQVRILRAVRAGDHVRQAGEDIRQGQLLLPAGHALRPADVGVLAAIGCASVSVVRQPRVAILATGDELVDVSEAAGPGQIRNSNEYTSVALVARYGGIPLPLGIARDTSESLVAKLQEGLSQQADLFLTSAGVSVGDFDMVKTVLATQGEMHFWQVAMKPGKPLAFGSIGGVPLLGLPGNPVAAMVAFEVFARPAILKLSGRTDWRKPSVTATLDEDVHNSGRRHYMRARVRREADGYHVSTRGSTVNVQGSGILSSLVWANGLVVVPETVTFIPAGSPVQVWMLDWPECVF